MKHITSQKHIKSYMQRQLLRKAREKDQSSSSTYSYVFWIDLFRGDARYNAKLHRNA